MIRFISVLFVLVILASCQDKSYNAQDILNTSIQRYGGENFQNATVRFKMRDLDYTMARKNGVPDFSVTRTLDTVSYKAIYKSGFQAYYIDGVEQEETIFTRRFINSKLEGLLYLFSIPHVFNQNAVIAERLEDVIIRKQSYYTVHITFTKVEGEPENEFYLYIHPETFYVDFFTEKYDLTSKRVLFKKAIHTRVVDGFVFSDYKLFDDPTGTMELSEFYKGYNEATLNPLNDLIYTNITVELNP